MKYLQTVILCLLFTTGHAQPLLLESFTAEYVPITGTPIVFQGGWTSQEKTVDLPMPFSVRLGLETYNAIKISSLGKVYGGSFKADYYGFHTFLRGFDDSEVSWLGEGTPPNRVVYIQFTNAGFTMDTEEESRASFQMLFYENGCFESRMGPASITASSVSSLFDGFNGPIVGYYRASDDYAGFLEGEPSDPTLNTIAESEAHLGGIPDEGQVYRFCPDSNLGIWSSSAEVPLSVILEGSVISVQAPEVGRWMGQIVDFSGRLIHSFTFVGTRGSVETPVDAGMYILKLSNEKGRSGNFRFVIGKPN